jgi:hypothetical protein
MVKYCIFDSSKARPMPKSGAEVKGVATPYLVVAS